MKVALIGALIVVVGALRIWMRSRQRRRHAAPHDTDHPAPASPLAVTQPPEMAEPVPRREEAGKAGAGLVGLVAGREIRERVRGRIFRVGTIFILLGVGAAIVIPKLHTNAPTPPQRVGVVGPATPALRQVVDYGGKQTDTPVRVVDHQTLVGAERALRAGNLDVVLVDEGRRIVIDQPPSSKGTSSTSDFAQALSADLGVLRAYQTAGLTPAQIQELAHAGRVPVQNLQGKSSKGAVQTTSVIGIVLLFLMLTQYNTWILMGVMQEKASRVVEVLLATLRPIQLLGGKVLGIGLVAMGQAALIVGFALAVGAVVGSDLLHGSAPLVLASELLWLVLGYAFYCWVYAAAGSMAERQDQVQTLVLPLSLPIILGYVLAITTASTGNPSLLFKVLAYVPPTAPFAMPVLVGLNQVQWWQFVASILITLVGTAGMAWVAAGIYRRAVLRSGQRVRLRDLMPSSSGRRRGRPGPPRVASIAD
jgi:ABC-2 type transport system permease protein